MLSDRTFKQGSATVTLGLFDGTTRVGRMIAFSPQATDHRLDVHGHGNTLIPVFFRAENLAFVAFHREPGDKRSPEPGAKTVRVHAVGGRHFRVDANAEAMRSPLGFYGVPGDNDSPFSEIFFYAHGVNAREGAEPLGDLLLQKGVLSPDRLAQGLEASVVHGSAPIGQILVQLNKVSPEDVEEAARTQKKKRQRIGEVLVESGLATPEDIDKALQEQKRRGGQNLGEVLVDLGIITELDHTLTLASKFSLPYVNLDTTTIDPDVARTVPRDFIERYVVLPFQADAGSVMVAISDPAATDMLDALRLHLKRRIVPALATPSQLSKFVKIYLEQRDRPAEELKLILGQLAAEDLRANPGQGLTKTSEDATDSAVIKLVNQIIIDGYRRRASDIHIEPNGENLPTVVRFRIDGDCVHYQNVPANVRSSVVARIKIMAALDIAERRKPQDGKICFRFGDRTIELRVATLPTVNGNEDVVARILTNSLPLPLDRLALSPRNLHEIRRAASAPYGLILCAGPTGSGKTSTLHSILGSINTEDVKIWTAEDPVEITQQGLRQVQMHPRIGLTFASAMRSFLRADPDVIMVGEMRDQETASIAVEASLTGHLVLSTLHTNSAPETVTRLIEMGIEPFNFADALLAVLAQRLVRALCSTCSVEYEASHAEHAEIVSALGGAELERRGIGAQTRPTLRRAKGCDDCSGTGYKSRLAIHEMLVMNDRLKRVVQRKATVKKIQAIAIEGGMTTLLQDGVDKALGGLTELRQVLAVCSH